MRWSVALAWRLPPRLRGISVCVHPSFGRLRGRGLRSPSSRQILCTRPWVYLTDTGLVKGHDGVSVENAVAVMLAKQAHVLSDTCGLEAGLHDIRSKDGAEVAFCLSSAGAPTQLVECKLADSSPHRVLLRFAAQFAEA